MPAHRSFVAMIVALATANGCAREGTYVHLLMQRSTGGGTPVASIALSLGLDGRTSTTELGGQGHEIALPTDSTLEIRTGAGTLTVDATLRDAGLRDIGHASGTVEVVRGKTSDLALRFETAGGSVGPSPEVDAGAPSSGVTLSTSEHDFGTHLTSTHSPAHRFTVINRSMVASGALTLQPPANPAFQIVENQCAGIALDPNASCTIDVIFSAPATEGESTDELAISSPLAGRTATRLHGRTIAPGALTITPGTSTFDPREVDTDGTAQIFTITNTGGETAGAISPLAITVSGSDAPSFAIIDSNCSGTLAPEAECSVTVRFHPHRVGPLGPTLVALAQPGGGNIATLGSSAFSVLRVVYEQAADPGPPVDPGHGRIQTADGIDCGSTHSPAQTLSACSKQYTAPLSITLHAINDWGFLRDYRGACTGSSFDCTVDMSHSRTVIARFSVANYIFATSSTYTLPQIKAAGTGTTDAERMVSGADALCAAAKAPIGGTLGGSNYRAWISTASQSAKQRIAATGARGWGTQELAVVDTLDELTDPTLPHLLHPPRATEIVPAFNPTQTERVWTGTNPDGSTGYNCQDYTSTSASDFVLIGFRIGGGGIWTAGEPINCAAAQTESYHLYCFGIDRQAHVVEPPPPAGARKIFVSATDFDPSSGIASADLKCATEALTANLPGSFRALLATSTASAASRFNTSGIGFFRTDGVRVTATPAELFVTNQYLMTSIDVDASGRQWIAHPLARSIDFPEVVYTGALTPTQVAHLNCHDWTSSATADRAEAGVAQSADPGWYQPNTTNSCDPTTTTRHRVYCVQE